MGTFIFLLILIACVMIGLKWWNRERENRRINESHRQGSEAYERFMQQDAKDREMLRQSLKENPLEPDTQGLGAKRIGFNGYNLTYKQLAYLNDHYDLHSMSFNALGITLGHLSHTCPSLFGEFRHLG